MVDAGTGGVSGRSVVAISFVVQQHARLDVVPEPDGLVIRTRRQPAPVRRERHRGDPTAMVLKRVQGCACVSVPKPDGLVPRTRRQPPPITRERHRHDLLPVALERVQGRISL
jgi:hypothetical protein